MRADDILIQMRMVKSENELALLREAFRISEKAVEAVLNRIKPGMMEVEVVGIAQEVMYQHGAEYEGHPLYVLSGRNSANAIGRPTLKKLIEGEVIQLNFGARFGGLLIQRRPSRRARPPVRRRARPAADGSGRGEQDDGDHACWRRSGLGGADGAGVHHRTRLWLRTSFTARAMAWA